MFLEGTNIQTFTKDMRHRQRLLTLTTLDAHVHYPCIWYPIFLQIAADKLAVEKATEKKAAEKEAAAKAASDKG